MLQIHKKWVPFGHKDLNTDCRIQMSQTNLKSGQIYVGRPLSKFSKVYFVVAHMKSQKRSESQKVRVLVLHSIKRPFEIVHQNGDSVDKTIWSTQ